MQVGSSFAHSHHLEHTDANGIKIDIVVVEQVTGRWRQLYPRHRQLCIVEHFFSPLACLGN